MKTVVFAYHDMGITGLDALQRAGFQIAAIFSHEDNPEENCWFGSVKKWARSNNISLHCPDTINTSEWIQNIAAWKPDILFSFYFRNLLHRELLSIPPAGAFNLHGSLLPSYRGRCPVNWVLVNGEKETGVTLHRMVEKPDAGEIAAQQTVPIALDDTALSLHKKMCRQAAVMLDGVLPLIKCGTVPSIPQDEQSASYFGGRTPEDGRIDWRWPALRIYNLIRAVTDPYPGAFTVTDRGEKMIIWWGLAETGVRPLEAGSIERESGAIFIAAGDRGRIKLLDIEVQGKRLKNEAIGCYFSDDERKQLQ